MNPTRHLILAFLPGLLLCGPLRAFDPPETIPGAPDAEEIAAVGDKAGRVHALTISPAPGNDEDVIQYHLHDGGSWQSAAEAFPSGLDCEFLDLALDEAGGLHGSFVGNGQVIYLELPPGSAPSHWQGNIVLPGPDALTTAEGGTSIDVSTSSGGDVTRHIAYASATPSLEYLRKSGDSDWSVATAVDGACLAPSISASAWPRTGLLQTSSASPVIAYTDDASSEVRVTYLFTTFTLPPSSSWTDPRTIGSTGFASFGKGPKLEIRDRVAHIAFMSSDTGSFGPHYFRRSIGFGVGGEQAFESTERIAATNNEKDLELALSPSGTPHVLYSRSESGQDWDARVGRRTGGDEWMLETARTTPFDEADDQELVFGPLGLKTAVFARPNVDAEAVRETGTPATAFAAQPVADIKNSATPAIVPDGRGGAWVSWVNSSNEVVLGRFEPGGSLETSVIPDDGRDPSGPPNPVTISREQLQLERLDSGRLALAYVTTVSTSAGSNTSYLHFFLFDGTTRAAFEEIELGEASIEPHIDMVIDGVSTWIHFGSRFNTEFYIFDQQASRRTAVEDRYEDTNPPVFGEPAIAVRDGNVARVGLKGNDLQASIFDPGDDTWYHGETVATFDDLSAVPDVRDVVIRAPSPGQAAGTLVAVGYAHGGGLYLSERLANTMWDQIQIGEISDVPNFEPDTGFVRLVTGPDPADFHYAWAPLKGGNTGTMWYDRFEDPDGDSDSVDFRSFLTPENPAFDFVESFELAIDRFGMRYLAAVDTGAGALRVSLPRAARDDDGDDIPLFMEHALCRDPGEADPGALLRAEFETSADGTTETATLSYDRPAGPAPVSDEVVLNAGIFRYELRSSPDLAAFGRPFPITDVTTINSLGTDNSPVEGAVSQRFEIGTALDIVPKRFFRLKVTMRPAN